MNYDLLSLVIFGIILYIFFRLNRKKFEVQGGIIALYKTKLGLNQMEKVSKWNRKFLKIFTNIGTFVGFAGMIFIFYILIKATLELVLGWFGLMPAAPPAIALVLPGVAIPGLGVTLSFWHWIISIFIVAAIHEFSHGFTAAFNKIKIKSSGFAFFGPILAAFVEPDEKELNSKPKMKQLAVYAAGPFSNIILGFLILAVSLFFITPAMGSLVDHEGVQIVSLEDGYPAKSSNLEVGDIITSVNDIQIENVDDFINILGETKPNEEIVIETENKTTSLTTIEHPKKEGKGYIGIIISSKETGFKKEIISKYGTFLPSVALWFAKLLFWLYVISLGVGLFNLLPLGPVDGGKMFYTAGLAIIKNEKKVKKIWKFISFFVLALIVINLLPSFIKLFVWIYNLLI